MIKKIFLPILGLCSIALYAADRPNILWLTSEDNSFHWIGCYGDPLTQTPNIDKLAAKGVRYTHAYSNGAVCAVTRNTLITGRYAPSMGTQNMRSRYPIPSTIKPYVHYLRDAGYYCVNKSKTDYNFEGNDKSYWDDCSGKAHWKNAPKDKPFFAVFNTTISHESSLFDNKKKNYRKNGTIPKTPRVNPAKVKLPAFLPDTPEIRQDWVTYYDIITAMDKQIGTWLKELEDAGLADDTIVFYYSDHGGILPRAKRYIYDTGNHVPLVIHFPKKWAHLAPSAPGTTVDKPVGFIDLPPTAFSLAGVDIPDQFQGIPFAGKAARPGNKYAYLYGQRFDQRMLRNVRGVTDGRYRYIRNFYPHRHRGIKSGYPHSQEGWKSFYKEQQSGNLNSAQASIWQNPQPVEELYDTQADPWEVKNLASSPEHAAILAEMRKSTLGTMKEIRDTGLVPEAMYGALSKGGTVNDYVHDKSFPYDDVMELALAVGEHAASLSRLKSAMQHKHPVIRYWGAVGCINLGAKAKDAKGELEGLLKDTNGAVKIAASEALIVLGHQATGTRGLSEVLGSTTFESEGLKALNVAEIHGVIKDVPKPVLAKAFKLGGYTKRISQDYQ